VKTLPKKNGRVSGGSKAVGRDKKQQAKPVAWKGRVRNLAEKRPETEKSEKEGKRSGQEQGDRSKKGVSGGKAKKSRKKL